MSQSPARSAQSMRMPLPLPDLPAPSHVSPPDAAQVPSGCYLLLVTPTLASLFTLQGTCRIDRSGGAACASGDLYSGFDLETGETIPTPDPTAGVPVFAIRHYRYYLRVTNFIEGNGGFTMTFEAHRLMRDSILLFGGGETRSLVEATLTLDMKRQENGDKAASAGRFAGQVLDDRGAIVAEASMEWVSPHLRRATIEIDTVSASPPPLANGAGLTWQSIFAPVGWDLTVIESNRDIPEPPDKAWNKAEAHAALRAYREKADLDQEWRYHILAVQQIDEPQAERGIMYDTTAAPDDPAPREGLLVASHWRIPNEPIWGLVQGKLASETDTYFRTTVHELGHAMNLEHVEGRTYMAQTTDIARESMNTPDTPFPTNIVWSFSSEDQHRLRHWSDLAVRPGGIKWGIANQTPLGAAPSPGIVLEIAPLLAQVPASAPVRIEARAVNRGATPVQGPDSLELSSGFLRGWVVDEAGVRRGFSPFAIGEGTGGIKTFQPNDQIEGSLTLLHGANGFLFPAAGAYRVILEAAWPDNGVMVSAIAETRVTVTPAVDAAHAEVARHLLATPTVLLTLALGGDHLPDAQEAVAAALKNPVLRPHYAYIEAKRLGTRFFDRAPDPAAVARLVGDDTIMSRAERKKAARLLQGAGKAETPRREPAIA